MSKQHNSSPHIDPTNPVVKLCIEGLRLNARGKTKEAEAFFRNAWNRRRNALDACITAHFRAKTKKTVQESLRWNLRALRYADKLPAETVKDFYPSLYINIASDYETLGDNAKAHHFYTQAAWTVTTISLGSHGYLLDNSIKAGLQRTDMK